MSAMACNSDFLLYPIGTAVRYWSTTHKQYIHVKVMADGGRDATGRRSVVVRMMEGNNEGISGMKYEDMLTLGPADVRRLLHSQNQHEQLMRQHLYQRAQQAPPVVQQVPHFGYMDPAVAQAALVALQKSAVATPLPQPWRPPVPVARTASPVAVPPVPPFAALPDHIAKAAPFVQPMPPVAVAPIMPIPAAKAAPVDVMPPAAVVPPIAVPPVPAVHSAPVMQPVPPAAPVAVAPPVAVVPPAAVPWWHHVVPPRNAAPDTPSSISCTSSMPGTPVVLPGGGDFKRRRGTRAGKDKTEKKDNRARASTDVLR